ncbi:unnamed protein product [Blumeria hordei]|uniref:Uncharacterized protein n=1 Tax=Blumeria hordei TaxID=2867405 RepID=A0A383UM76_BLUHO|nr:unnamed protein product [Blumeria hordei]
MQMRLTTEEMGDGCARRQTLGHMERFPSSPATLASQQNAWRKRPWLVSIESRRQGQRPIDAFYEPGCELRLGHEAMIQKCPAHPSFLTGATRSKA